MLTFTHCASNNPSVVHLQSYYHANSVTCTDRQRYSLDTQSKAKHTHARTQTQMQDSLAKSTMTRQSHCQSPLLSKLSSAVILS